MDRRYFEDLDIGQCFGGESYTVPADEMLAFSRKWDPRPLHIDEAAGKAAGFGGIIASGSYTTSILSLLSMRSRQKDGDHAVIAAMKVENAMPRPVHAGDTLTFTAEIEARRESRSRPDAGIVTTQGRLTNQNGKVVLESRTTTLVSKRP